MAIKIKRYACVLTTTLVYLFAPEKTWASPYYTQTKETMTNNSSTDPREHHHSHDAKANTSQVSSPTQAPTVITTSPTISPTISPTANPTATPSASPTTDAATTSAVGSASSSTTTSSVKIGSSSSAADNRITSARASSQTQGNQTSGYKGNHRPLSAESKPKWALLGVGLFVVIGTASLVARRAYRKRTKKIRGKDTSWKVPLVNIEDETPYDQQNVLLVRV